MVVDGLSRTGDRQLPEEESSTETTVHTSSSVKGVRMSRSVYRERLEDQGSEGYKEEGPGTGWSIQ